MIQSIKENILRRDLDDWCYSYNKLQTHALFDIELLSRILYIVAVDMLANVEYVFNVMITHWPTSWDNNTYIMFGIWCIPKTK